MCNDNSIINWCQNEEGYELIFDKNSIVNCINFVYEFKYGTRIYTDYTNIKHEKIILKCV